MLPLSRIVPALLAGGAMAPTATAQEPDAPTLFQVNCASCHGADGDGKGTTELDRPARSFREGGFSYGNTPEALFRTITYGIPGTPMPGFDTSLDEAERYALANFVLTLGPDVRQVTPEETTLVVGERPVVVRGHLPPISDTATEHPRGLLLGTTSGLTFEYRTDDVRLLGVRQGGFVERTDWTGRGGTPLRPLGSVVHLLEGGDPAALFRLAEDSAEPAHPLAAALRGTWIRGADVGLAYELRASRDGPPLAHVREAVAGFGASFGAGYRRTFELERAERELALVLELPRVGDDERLESFFAADPEGRHGSRAWTIVRRADGTTECVGAVVTGATPRGARGRLELSLVSGATATLHVVTVLAPEWNDEVRAGLFRVAFP